MQKIMIAAIALTFSNVCFAQKYISRTGKVTFFSTTPVENIEAFTNEAGSVINAGTGEVMFVIPIKSFRFEKALMQEHFNENYMESDKFPKAEFNGKIANLQDVDFKKDGTYNVKVAGRLTIHGVTKDVTIPGTITVKGSTITANSKFMVRNEDYKIKIPTVVSTKIAEQIEVTVNSVMNAQ